MKNPLIYDLPTRIFHWIFAIGFLSAFLIAKTAGDSNRFPYHMLIGMTLSFSVILRVLWGLIGSRYARFSSFSLRPKLLIQYLKSVAAGKGELHAGHNPASSWVGLTLMVLVFFLGFTGFSMVSEQAPEVFEEIHELLGTVAILLVAAHVAGIGVHTFTHKDPIGLSMILGTKSTAQESDAIPHSYRAVGIIFFLAVASYAGYLISHYNSNTQSLYFFGQNIQLGEGDGSALPEHE